MRRIKLDLNKEYGIVFDGGGARGAYQIGAWKALREAGVKINAVAGTSVGALNGALLCMDDIELAEDLWENITYSDVMQIDDDLMNGVFGGDYKVPVKVLLKAVWEKIKDGGVDITPLKELINTHVDEEKIRTCGKEFCLVTYSMSNRQSLELGIDDITLGKLGDYLLASAYLIGFKNEPLNGKKYVDGGITNNVPTRTLVERGYHDIIQVRIFGPGIARKAEIPEEGSFYEIQPRVGLGSIIEFSPKRSRQNLKIGYYDAQRLLYGLEGIIYYIEQTNEEWYYEEIIKNVSELEKKQISMMLKLPINSTGKELVMGMLEASAKLMRIPKYRIYTVDELWDLVEDKYREYDFENLELLPKFVHIITGMREDYKMDLKGRHFLSLHDYSPAEIDYLVTLAGELKEKKKQGIPVDVLKGKNIALIFQKTSTRTRCSFEVAASDLGMGTTYLSPDASQIGKKESIKDTARVLGRIYDGIEYRGFGQEIVEELAAHAGVPVWNGLTNEYHPTQMLADMLTIKEHFGKVKGLTLAYMGDARYNMGNSLMILCAKMGINYVVCSPKKYFPEPELIAQCEEYAKESGATLTFSEDVMTATKGVDVVYTDVWVSMGEPDEIWAERIQELSPYKVTKEVMENAGSQAIFLHCLPSFHDLNTTVGYEQCTKFGLTELEVTDEVFESEQSKVFDEAENRMHTIKAVMAATLGAEFGTN